MNLVNLKVASEILIRTPSSKKRHCQRIQTTTAVVRRERLRG
jgi:hypothetical protein